MALGPNETVPGRPFTDVVLIERDLSILYGILGDLDSLLTESQAGTRRIVPFRRMAWRVDGLVHRHIICNEKRLRTHPGLCVVGFFGERRTEVDMAPLEKANRAIVGEFANYPGITSYSSLELPGGYWANLVLHDDPSDTDYWRRSELHTRAVKMLSRAHYRNVRIHNAQLSAPVPRQPTIGLLRTKYYDYSGETDWRAERALSPWPEARGKGTPPAKPVG